jgi:tRNA threonylcarbamoyl adenosine modification protein YeaZ
MTAALALCGSNLAGDVAFSVALRTGGGDFTARSPIGGRGDLAAMVAEVCGAAGMAPSGLTELRLDVGPGSYTGLRVAITFARFLQRFGHLPVFGLDSLALLANRSRGAARIRPLLDARRERWHTALFATVADELVELERAAAVPFAELLAAVQEGDVCVLPAATAPAVGEALAGRGATLVAVREVVAAEMWSEGLPWFAARSEDLLPRYLMPSYAEG